MDCERLRHTLQRLPKRPCLLGIFSGLGPAAIPAESKTLRIGDADLRSQRQRGRGLWPISLCCGCVGGLRRKPSSRLHCFLATDAHGWTRIKQFFLIRVYPWPRTLGLLFGLAALFFVVPALFHSLQTLFAALGAFGCALYKLGAH